MAAMKKTLAPTDFSKFADNALKQAVEMAKQSMAKIYLFHAIPIVQQCAVDYCLDNAMSRYGNGNNIYSINRKW